MATLFISAEHRDFSEYLLIMLVKHRSLVVLDHVLIA